MKNSQAFHRPPAIGPPDDALHDPPPQDAEREAPGGADAERLPPLLLSAPISDWGNARCFEAQHRHVLRHRSGVGWCFFNGTRWEEGGGHEAYRRAGHIVEQRLAALDGHTPRPGEEEGVVAARRTLVRCGNHGGLRALLRSAESLMHVDESAFSAHPHLLGAPNGVVDLRDGSLRPHDPELWMTQCAGAVYDPDARSDLWERTVLEVADGDEELALFLQRIAGYACTGATSAQYYFHFFGEGSNGKSLLTDLWAEALGGFGPTGYAANLAVETVVGRRERMAGAVAPDVLALRGKRLALCSETGEDQPINTQRVKDLTGGDALTGRAPFHREVTFTPTHTLIGRGNHLPLVEGSDHGLWRRLLVVPFRRRFPPSELGRRLRSADSLRAILAWMVRGAVSFYRDGLPVPGAVADASRNYRSDADQVRVWVEAECSEDRAAESDGGTLFRAYDAWCARYREARISHSRFTRRMEQLGFARRKSNGKVLLSGIRLDPRRLEPGSPAVP